MLSINIEVMIDIFSAAGVEATEEQVKEVAECYEQHLECMREMNSYQFIGSPSESCEECLKLTEKIKNLEFEIEIYKNSVKKRRSASHVWIESGSVMYEH